MNLREKDRITVNLPCTFQKAARHFTGMVTNMSRVGLLTVWHSCDLNLPDVKHGEIWSVEIELPKHELFAQNAFYCKAAVVRTGRDRKNNREVAFRIDRMVAAALRARTMNISIDTQYVM